MKSQTCGWITVDDVTDTKCTVDTLEEFMTSDNLKRVFEYRCNLKLQATAMNLGRRMMDKEDAFDVWNDEQVFGGQDLALAYGEYAQTHFDTTLLKKIESREKKDFVFLKTDTKRICEILCKLSALFKIQRDFASWLEHGYFTTDHCQMIRGELKRLLEQMKPFAVPLTDYFQPADDFNDSMIAPNDGDLYKSAQTQIYSAPKTFERAANWKELLARPKL